MEKRCVCADLWRRRSAGITSGCRHDPATCISCGTQPDAEKEDGDPRPVWSCEDPPMFAKHVKALRDSDYKEAQGLKWTSLGVLVDRLGEQLRLSLVHGRLCHGKIARTG